MVPASAAANLRLLPLRCRLRLRRLCVSWGLRLAPLQQQWKQGVCTAIKAPKPALWVRAHETQLSFPAAMGQHQRTSSGDERKSQNNQWECPSRGFTPAGALAAAETALLGAGALAVCVATMAPGMGVAVASALLSPTGVAPALKIAREHA